MVDDQKNVVGAAPRRERRAQPLPHRRTSILAFNAHGKLYIQQRILTKDVFPGDYDPAAGGVVLAGESYEESAQREPSRRSLYKQRSPRLPQAPRAARRRPGGPFSGCEPGRGHCLYSLRTGDILMSLRSILIAMIIVMGLRAQAHSEVILESDDTVATLSGTWTHSTNGVGFYGPDFATAPGGGTVETARFFTPRPISTTGTWCIQARWTTGMVPPRAAAARYQVFDGTILRATFLGNQQLNGGVWNRLGCVLLTGGRIGEVRLSDTGVVAPSIVVADGVRWVWDEGPITQDFCVAVNEGFGSGGTTFVGKGFTMPVAGRCKPWAGITRTATTVVGTSTGAACLSNDQKLLTITVQTTAPGFLGIGTTATDHIELCPATATLGCPIGTGLDQGTFGGPAAQTPCTTALVTIPSVHD